MDNTIRIYTRIYPPPPNLLKKSVKNCSVSRTSLHVTRCWVRVELSRQASTFSTPARSSSIRRSLHPPPSSLSRPPPVCARVQGWHEYTTLSGKLERISYRSSGRTMENEIKHQNISACLKIHTDVKTQDYALYVYTHTHTIVNKWRKTDWMSNWMSKVWTH